MGSVTAQPWTEASVEWALQPPVFPGPQPSCCLPDALHVLLGVGDLPSPSLGPGTHPGGSTQAPPCTPTPRAASTCTPIPTVISVQLALSRGPQDGPARGSGGKPQDS